MMWQTASVHSKPADIFDPPRPPRHGLLFLHGIGQETLVGNPVWTKLLADRNLACVCPHGKRSWWLNRVCAEFDSAFSPEKYLLDAVIPFFKERWNITPQAIGVIGISMGGQGALRLAFRQPRLFPVAAGIASALDFHEWYGEGTPLDEMYDSKEQCRQDTALMYIRPDDYPPHVYFCIDPDDVDWYRGNDRLHEKLSALGVPHTMDLETKAGGHSWTYFNRMAEPALRFVAEGLERESRRLL